MIVAQRTLSTPVRQARRAIGDPADRTKVEGENLAGLLALRGEE